MKSVRKVELCIENCKRNSSRAAYTREIAAPIQRNFIVHEAGRVSLQGPKTSETPWKTGVTRVGSGVRAQEATTNVGFAVAILVVVILRRALVAYRVEPVILAACLVLAEDRFITRRKRAPKQK